MIRQGVVVRTEDGRLMAQVERSEACEKCGACAHGQVATQRYPLPDGTFQPGDPVAIELPDRGVLPAALLGYGVPLVMLLAGLLIGAALSLPEYAQALMALAFAVAAYVALHALEPRFRKSPRFGCAIRHDSVSKPAQSDK